jgi:hypothetical protein
MRLLCGLLVSRLRSPVSRTGTASCPFSRQGPVRLGVCEHAGGDLLRQGRDDRPGGQLGGAWGTRTAPGSPPGCGATGPVGDRTRPAGRRAHGRNAAEAIGAYRGVQPDSQPLRQGSKHATSGLPWPFLSESRSTDVANRLCLLYPPDLFLPGSQTRKYLPAILRGFCQDLGFRLLSKGLCGSFPL